MTRSRRIAIWSAAAAIAVYGALLRLDAFVDKYGTLDHPACARIVTHDFAALARAIRPAGVHWERIARPYVGGDPITYLKYGREMTSFYQPHVREPVFLGLTRVSLWVLGGQDAAVSLASAAGSVLLIVATFLLGAAVAEPAGGLAAALVIAVDRDMISWSVDGWRDDTFAAFVVLSAWSLLRLRARATFGAAVACGVICGFTCLTRITALSFIVPALAWIAIEGDRQDRRVRIERTALAAVIAAVVILPYLISCAIATGDPFLSINYHTSYYRFAEGQRIDQPMSAGQYVWRKLLAHPIATTDVGVTGLFVRPFVTKWTGLGIWSAWLGTCLMWCSLAGLAAWLFSGKGRLVLLIILCSLFPYAFTWNVGGGDQWRFTMHVYPLYAIAATYAIALAARLAQPGAWRVGASKAAVVVVLGAAAAVLYLALPWFVVREAIRLGESVSVEAGGRDALFFRSGWSPPRGAGNVIVRTSREPRAVVHFPLPAQGDYDIVLRLDPIDPARDASAQVLFNQQLAARFGFAIDPNRIGSYRMTLPREWTKPGDNTISIVAQGAAGVRLWLVRVLPK